MSTEPKQTDTAGDYAALKDLVDSHQYAYTVLAARIDRLAVEANADREKAHDLIADLKTFLKREVNRLDRKLP